LRWIEWEGRGKKGKRKGRSRIEKGGNKKKKGVPQNFCAILAPHPDFTEKGKSEVNVDGGRGTLGEGRGKGGRGGGEGCAAQCSKGSKGKGGGEGGTGGGWETRVFADTRATEQRCGYLRGGRIKKKGKGGREGRRGKKKTPTA